MGRHQDHPPPPELRVPVDSDRRRRSDPAAANPGARPAAPAGPEVLPDANVRDRPSVSPNGPPLDRAQLQARGSRRSDTCSSSAPHSGPLHQPAGQACPQGQCGLRNDSRIRQGRNSQSPAARDASFDKVAVMKFVRKWSLSRRVHVTKYADPVKHAHIPLHSAAVSTIDLDAVAHKMSNAAAQRFRELLLYLEEAPPSPGAAPRSSLAVADAAKLVTDGNAIKLDSADGTRGWCSPFCVIEDKPTGSRRRFILWPREQNARLYAAGFKSAVDLEHVSAYLDAVRSEAGVTRDLKVGFWQCPLTARARAALRFRDVAGNVYEPTRLPMGHCCAVDVMQLITQVIAGDKTVCAPPHAERKLVPHIWVDGLRYAGSRLEVADAVARADARASQLGATWKETPPVETRYEFIGVLWDHVAHSVVVAPKTADKIALVNLAANPTASMAEQLVGRLIFASGAVRLPLAPYYFTLKWARRLSGSVTAGKLAPDQFVVVPPFARKQLEEWRAAVAVPLVIRQRAPLGDDITLFTDASEAGWGAVLVGSGAVLGATGGRWTADERAHINALELLALLHGLTSFAATIRDARRFHVRVDNTTTLFSTRKGNTRSANLAPFVDRVQVALRNLDVPTDIAYVRSADNPADAPSRGLPASMINPAFVPGRAVLTTRRS